MKGLADAGNNVDCKIASTGNNFGANFEKFDDEGQGGVDYDAVKIVNELK